MMDPLLSYVVTGFGFLLGVMTFAVIFLGKKIPGDSSKPQEVEFKGFKIKANSMVMLLVVSVVVAVLPLLIQSWLASKKPQELQLALSEAQEQVAALNKALKEVQARPDAKQSLMLYITGQVLDTNGPVDRARVTITNLKGAKPAAPIAPLSTIETGPSGSFDFPPLAFGEGDRYKVVAAKEGHVEQYFYMGPAGAIDVKTVLVAKK